MFLKESSTPVKRPTTPLGGSGVKRMYFEPSRTPTPPPRDDSDDSYPIFPPAHCMNPQEILESITTDPNIYQGNITCIPRVIPAREAAFEELPPEAADLIDQDLLRSYFDHVGASRLFRHQTETIEALLVEESPNTCIATSTSSGKSMAFNLPILSELIKADGEATALYIYPTKALTQDQKRAIDQVVEKRREMRDQMGESAGVFAEIIDGDVSDKSRRREILDTCNLVLTNPDTIHYYFLPFHRQIQSFLKRLRFVVIDEAHAYHGGFGGHVASVLRRLRRIVDHYQPESSQLQFVFCSATIGNPAEHVSNLAGIPCQRLISNDGSPCGEKILTVWNSKAGDGIGDLVKVLCKFTMNGVRFICFCKNRFATERILAAIRSKLAKTNTAALSDRVVSYRAGYNMDERRKLEQGIFSGAVLGVIATSALELGMDIGSLDVAVSFGFPGSIHSLWQQWGRAGRGSRSSLCMLFCKEEDVLDSFIGQDADERLLELDVEDAVIQTSNPSIVYDHLVAADQELAMKKAEEWTECRSKFWPDIDEATFVKAKKAAPFASSSKRFAIRNIDTRKVIVECDKRVIDSYDITKALLYVFPGATLLVNGDEYRVVDLKLNLKENDSSKAIAVRATHDYFSRPYDVTTVTPQIPAIETQIGGLFNRSRVDVALKVSGFYKLNKKKPHDKIPGGFEALELPTIMFNSYAAWIDLTCLGEDDLSREAGAHGAAHAIFLASCRRLLFSSQSDVRCYCSDTQRRRILIYDVQKDGVGAADAIFKRYKEILILAKKIVAECSCQCGCMKCMLLSVCSMNNEFMDKSASIALLDTLVQSLPNHP